MPSNRIRHLGALGLVMTVGLLLAVAAQVTSTAAATGSSGAHASDTFRGKVRIQLRGTNGRFTIYGAIGDHGRWIESGGLYRLRTLIGAKGSIEIKIGWYGGKPRDCQCNWRIIKGTKAYAGLRGRGHEEGMYEGYWVGGYTPTTRLTMFGTVSQ